MAEKSIEERLKILEEKNKHLEHEITRLSAINEIQNLMGRYEAVHNNSEMSKSAELFAQHTPDTWAELGTWGRFEGIEAIRKLFTSMEAYLPGEHGKEGLMFWHDLATPIIEVAGDCKTAKATWRSPGHETRPRDGKLTALWCWGTYAIDFVKEDGEWKIWHFRWFRLFITPFYTSWVDRPRDKEVTTLPEAEIFTKEREDHPDIYHQPYFPDVVQKSIPPAPKPYDTWTEKDVGWYLRPTEHP
jgi:hypothetical protein